MMNYKYRWMNLYKDEISEWRNDKEHMQIVLLRIEAEE